MHHISTRVVIECTIVMTLRFRYTTKVQNTVDTSNHILLVRVPVVTQQSGHWFNMKTLSHHNDVIMGTIASQITSPTIVYSAVYSGADKRKQMRRQWDPLILPLLVRRHVYIELPLDLCLLLLLQCGMYFFIFHRVIAGPTVCWRKYSTI